MNKGTKFHQPVNCITQTENYFSLLSLKTPLPLQSELHMGATGIDSLCGSVVSTSGVGLDLP